MNRDAFKAYASVYHDEVTGSRILIVVERPDGVVYRIVTDFGYFQEIPHRYLNYVTDLNPEKIDAIILTHNHIDHTGLVPKAVREGYNKPIYMTEITKLFVGPFWNDSASQQVENLMDIKKRFPDEADKFEIPYEQKDVEDTLKLCKGIPFKKTIEILPGVKLTFLEIGHLLGAGMVLLQCSYPGRKSFNFFFTGDYKLTNKLFKMPSIPKWLRKMELIMFHESTYGTTDDDEVKKCFRENMIEAFSKRQNILIGAFAQGRMQEMLYDFKIMQDEGLIPEEYIIGVDGPLGIETTLKYQKVLEWFSPAHKDFLPKGLVFMEPGGRDHVLDDGIPKIIITTSGMLSNGPARVYVPAFLENKNSLIHLVGYAAEETLARKLLEAKDAEFVKIGSKEIKKLCEVKTTREMSSHATRDQMIGFINLFTNIVFLGINHGDHEVKKAFAQTVVEQCPNVGEVAILDREHMVCIYQNGLSKEPFSNVKIRQMNAGLCCDSKLYFGKENYSASKNKPKISKTKLKKLRKRERKTRRCRMKK